MMNNIFAHATLTPSDYQSQFLLYDYAFEHFYDAIRFISAISAKYCLITNIAESLLARAGFLFSPLFYTLSRAFQYFYA